MTCSLDLQVARRRLRAQDARTDERSALSATHTLRTDEKGALSLSLSCIVLVYQDLSSLVYPHVCILSMTIRHLEYHDTRIDTPLLSLCLSLISFHSVSLQMALLNYILGPGGWCALAQLTSVTSVWVWSEREAQVCDLGVGVE